MLYLLVSDVGQAIVSSKSEYGAQLIASQEGSEIDWFSKNIDVIELRDNRALIVLEGESCYDAWYRRP